MVNHPNRSKAARAERQAENDAKYADLVEDIAERCDGDIFALITTMTDCDIAEVLALKPDLVMDSDMLPLFLNAVSTELLRERVSGLSLSARRANLGTATIAALAIMCAGVVRESVREEITAQGAA